MAFLQLEKGQVHNYCKELYVLLGKLNAQLHFSSIEEVMAMGTHLFLQQFQEDCNLIGQSIAKTYYLGETASV